MNEVQVIVMLPHGEEVWDVSIEPGETVDDAVAATQAILGDQAKVRHPDESWSVVSDKE
jgi:hypothetical protein